MAKASDNPFPSLLLVEQAAAPATPAAGQARLYRGTDNKLYIVDDAGVATEVGAATSGGGAGELACVEATASATYTNTTTTDTDLDATNLAVTFTVPASGKVLVSFDALLEITAGTFEWTLREAAATLKAATLGSATYARRHVEFRVTGLTPGASKTYKWGHRRLGATTGTTNVYTGGAGGTNGNAIMTVTALP